MEKNVPSQLSGGKKKEKKKKELAKLGLNHQWAEQNIKTECAARGALLRPLSTHCVRPGVFAKLLGLCVMVLEWM